MRNLEEGDSWQQIIADFAGTVFIVVLGFLAMWSVGRL